MRRLIAFITSIALVGCATGPVPLPVENLATSAQTKVEDLRPKNESTREIFSLLITSDLYGHQRLAEDLTDPTGPRLFAHRLQEKYGTGSVPLTKLHHFVVYINRRAEHKSMALGTALGGVVGAVLAGSTVKREGVVSHTLVDAESFAKLSGVNEYKRASYTDADPVASTSAFVIFIESESQGQRRFTRTVSPIKPSQAGQKTPLHQALESAIHFNLNP